MKSSNLIRLKTLAWIEEDHALFVVKNHDSVKGDDYYRPVGGSVNFGERTMNALLREVNEELDTTITITGDPLIVENIFVCDGEIGHEIDYLYPSRFNDPGFYARKIYSLREDSGETFDALWIEIEACLTGKHRLVPEELLEWYRSTK